jgi:hypothetical protein
MQCRYVSGKYMYFITANMGSAHLDKEMVSKIGLTFSQLHRTKNNSIKMVRGLKKSELLPGDRIDYLEKLS